MTWVSVSVRIRIRVRAWVRVRVRIRIRVRALTHNKKTTQAHKTKVTRGDHFQAFRQRWNLVMQKNLTHLIPSIYFLHVYFITVVDDPDASEKHKSKPERQHGPPSGFEKLDVHARA